MEFRNDKKIDTTIKYVYYLISVILCLFLILLTNRILNDLGQSVTYPDQANLGNKTTTDSLNALQKSIGFEMERYETKATQLEKSVELAEKNYQDAKASFDNWLLTRAVLGDPSKDKAVIDRTETLDSYFTIRQNWNKEAAKIQDTLSVWRAKMAVINDQMYIENEQTARLFNAEVQTYELKVFLIRLLFILPILLLGIYFYIKFRNHKYWPLFFGFTLFSLYAFFIGLVPYLPYYGGYVRYTVGILMSVLGGYYAINKIRTYLEQRKEELQQSAAERAQKVGSDTAFKAFEQHICPSCGKDFMFKNWALAKQTPSDAGLIVSNFCRQCGFELYKNCAQCGEKHFAHLPYCSSCGVANERKN
jgi:hypothetical protein